MCRNIRTLFNFDPPVTSEEIRVASLQFVRKISGFNKPSKANEPAFLTAVEEIAEISSRYIHSLETNAPPKNREEEALRRRLVPPRGSATEGKQLRSFRGNSGLRSQQNRKSIPNLFVIFVVFCANFLRFFTAGPALWSAAFRRATP